MIKFNNLFLLSTSNTRGSKQPYQELIKENNFGEELNDAFALNLSAQSYREVQKMLVKCLRIDPAERRTVERCFDTLEKFKTEIGDMQKTVAEKVNGIKLQFFR